MVPSLDERPQLTVPEAAAISRVLAHYDSRTVEVVLDAQLMFRMLEPRWARKPNHWSRIWPSSIGLSRWLLAEPLHALGSSSTELGCGLGLVSMTLAHRGLSALGTDRVTHALAFTARNAANNELTGLSVSHLDWGEPGGAPSGLIVGADIVYEAVAPDRLFAMLDTDGLLIPGGKLVIGGPRARSDLLTELAHRMVREGYVHSEVSSIVEWGGRDELIDVHVLMRP